MLLGDSHAGEHVAGSLGFGLDTGQDRRGAAREHDPRRWQQTRQGDSLAEALALTIEGMGMAGHRDDATLSAALSELAQKAPFLKLLGSYPTALD